MAGNKKKESFDPDQFAAFCIELDIWERTPNGGLAVKPGPLRYTTAEVTRRFKERMKKKT